MYEIDFELSVELEDIDTDEFMEQTDEKLYESYRGSVSPALCHGEPVIHGTVEATDPDGWVEALIPVLIYLRSLGVHTKAIRQTNVLQLA